MMNKNKDIESDEIVKIKNESIDLEATVTDIDPNDKSYFSNSSQMNLISEASQISQLDDQQIFKQKSNTSSMT